MPDAPTSPTETICTKRTALRTTKLTESATAALLTDFQSGTSSRKLAAKYGIHRTKVTQIAREAGINTERHRHSAEQIEHICHLYSEGHSCASIADQLDMHAGSIWAVLKRADMPMRQVHQRRQKM